MANVRSKGKSSSRTEKKNGQAGNAGSGEARGGNSTKRVSRGGISKRRSGADIDGDLDMADSTRRGQKAAVDNGGRKKKSKVSAKTVNAIARHIGLGNNTTVATGSGRNGRKSKPVPDNLTWLRIHGLQDSKAASNQGGGTVELIAFLERKANALLSRTSKSTVMVKKHRLQGDSLLVAATKEHAEDILKCNHFVFAGATLEIFLAEPPASPTTAAAKMSVESVKLENGLKAVLAARYSVETKMLQLDSLAQEDFIRGNDLFTTPDRVDKTFRIFMKICHELFPTRRSKQEAIESISLCANGIDHVSQIDSLAVTFPDLKHLNLSNNSFKTLADLQPWKAKFRSLETLLLNLNPIEDTITPTQDYRPTLVEWFPSLQNLNNVTVRTPEEATAAKKNSGPHAIPQFGSALLEPSGLSVEFLVDFLANIDDNKLSLLSRYYDDKSTFSLSIDNTVRNRNSDEANTNSTPQNLPWAPYLRFSRNLVKISHTSTRVQRLMVGSTVIGELWKQLPATRHPNPHQNPEKYIVETMPMTGLADPTRQNKMGVPGAMVFVHGEFEEFDPANHVHGLRSFSRTFVLGPADPTKSPMPFRVVSDLWSIRNHRPLPSQAPVPSNDVVGVPSGPSVPGNVAGVAGVAPTGSAQLSITDKQNMVIAFSQQTNLTLAAAETALSNPDIDWSPERAMAAFEANKANLPRELFQAQ